VDEAAAVIGAGTTLKSAAVNGHCTFVRGPLTLQIAQPARLDNKSVLEQAIDAAMKNDNGKPEPGIGDKAYVSGNSKRISFLKGNAFVIVDLMGEGAGPSQLPAFKAAMKKMASRF
jgi:hypothetical protein